MSTITRNRETLISQKKENRVEQMKARNKDKRETAMKKVDKLNPENRPRKATSISSTNSQSAPSRKRGRMPDFDAIHKQHFQKMEDLDVYLQRKKQRVEEHETPKKEIKSSISTNVVANNDTNISQPLNKVITTTEMQFSIGASKKEKPKLPPIPTQSRSTAPFQFSLDFLSKSPNSIQNTHLPLVSSQTNSSSKSHTSKSASCSTLPSSKRISSSTSGSKSAVPISKPKPQPKRPPTACSNKTSKTTFLGSENIKPKTKNKSVPI